MASTLRQKEAIRAALLAFFAGAHAVTEEVEKSQSAKGDSEERREMLQADYARIQTSLEGIEMFNEILNEEELYPFGNEWPKEAFVELAAKLIVPKVTFDDETELRFRFKKGFKRMLADIASSIESGAKNYSSVDHWMALLINTSFHAGANIAARLAENPKAYYAAIQELESESEAWGKYPQLVNFFERQLRRETRRRTGLVSDLDL